MSKFIVSPNVPILSALAFEADWRSISAHSIPGRRQSSLAKFCVEGSSPHHQEVGIVGSFCERADLKECARICTNFFPATRGQYQLARVICWLDCLVVAIQYQKLTYNSKKCMLIN